jgi:hypothetical protein
VQPLSLDILAANAYRTLGLSASATQAEIDGAARRMRIWPDERRIPPTPWDAPWLGPLRRSRGDIERALSALNEPASRAEHRLLWYHARAPATEAEHASAMNQTLPLAYRHDDVLQALHSAYINDPAITQPARWQSVMEGVNGLASMPEFAAWMSRVEENGNFEKRAAAAELYEAIDELPGAVLAALVPKAQEAVDRDDAQACADIAMILRAGGKGAASPLRLLLDRLEDQLNQQCREVEIELREKLRTNHSQPAPFYAQNREACHQAATVYNQTISPSLNRFLKLAEADSDRADRARATCAQLLALMAMGWEWAGRFIKAEATQAVALELITGMPGETSIRTDHERYKDLANRERNAAVGWTGLSTQWQTPQTKPERKAKSRSKVKSGISGLWLVGMILSFVVRGFLSTDHHSSSTPDYLYPSLQTPQPHNAAMERIQRELKLRPFADPPKHAPTSGSPLPDSSYLTLSPLPPVQQKSSPLTGTPKSPPKLGSDPARANDPFGESSREQ